jgi:dihydropteroate synthase
MTEWFRPIAQTDALRPADARPLAGGWAWFTMAERLTRAGSRGLVPATSVPADVLDRLTTSRAPFAGLELDVPRLMGVVNVTPDSFSDGGLFATTEAALEQASSLARAGSDILDIGGESTRPGSAGVAEVDEIARVEPVIAAIRWAGVATPVSVDTRKAAVARAAISAGAQAVNDVSALTFDAGLAGAVVDAGVPVVLMHAQGDPKTMQLAPIYEDVALDVYDALEARIAACVAAGIAKDRLIADPGIGFGKSFRHNLDLLRQFTLFHGLGVPLLMGLSRKGFIGALTGEKLAANRVNGSVGGAVWAALNGAHILRVHDVKATVEALAVARASADPEVAGL